MRRTLIGVVAASLLWAAAACDEPSAGGVPTAGGTPSASAAAGDPVAFARCLREHGQNVGDPQPGVDWRPPDPRTDEQKQAFEACRPLLAATAGSEVPTAQELESMRAFAKCMRDHDIPVADPVPGEPGGGKLTVHGRFEHAGKDQLLGDPQVKAAMSACIALLPDRFRPTAE